MSIESHILYFEISIMHLSFASHMCRNHKQCVNEFKPVRSTYYVITVQIKCHCFCIYLPIIGCKLNLSRFSMGHYPSLYLYFYNTILQMSVNDSSDFKLFISFRKKPIQLKRRRTFSDLSIHTVRG